MSSRVFHVFFLSSLCPHAPQIFVALYFTHGLPKKQWYEHIIGKWDDPYIAYFHPRDKTKGAIRRFFDKLVIDGIITDLQFLRYLSDDELHAMLPAWVVDDVQNDRLDSRNASRPTSADGDSD